MKRHQSAFGVAGAIVVAWTIASVLAIALQCDIEQPWKSPGADCSGSVRPMVPIFSLGKYADNVCRAFAGQSSIFSTSSQRSALLRLLDIWSGRSRPQ